MRSLDDIGNIVLLWQRAKRNSGAGAGHGHRYASARHCAAELRNWMGTGEAVGGVVIMRVGENAQKVIERVKDQIGPVQPSLPKGLQDRAPSMIARS